jgi:3-dehydroquinate dehydratase I
MKNQILVQLKQTPPLLVASLDGDDLPFLLDEARGLRADLAEIRLDRWGTFLHDEFQVKMTRLKERYQVPLLVSFRGGHPFPSWWQPAFWRALSNAVLVDIEWNPKYPWREIVKSCRQFGPGLIISHHEFAQTPPVKKLVKIARAAYGKKADVVKIATRVKTEEDIRTLFELNQAFAPKRLMTTMGMGPLGSLSRLAGPLFHSCLVYGYIGTPTANGQLPFRELQERMRALYPRYDANYQSRLLKASGAAQRA